MDVFFTFILPNYLDFRNKKAGKTVVEQLARPPFESIAGLVLSFVKQLQDHILKSRASTGLLVFRRKILCDPKPKLVYRKF